MCRHQHPASSSLSGRRGCLSTLLVRVGLVVKPMSCCSLCVTCCPGVLQRAHYATQARTLEDPTSRRLVAYYYRHDFGLRDDWSAGLAVE